MTISTTDNKIIHSGDGVITVFSYNYRMDNDYDMQVWIDDNLQPSGYLVARNVDNVGGTVTFDIAPENLTVITLLRVIPQTQETDYVPYDAFPAEAHEDALDKLTMEIQQIQEQVDRNTQGIGVDIGDTITNAPPYDAGKCYKWASDQQKLINSTFDPDEQVVIATNAANNAALSESNAAISAGNASDSEDRAQEWSENPEDVPVIPGEFSAFHWAKKSEDAAAEGEANTSSNSGTGEGVALPKAGVDLPFKSLKVTGNGSISSDSTSVTIQVDGSDDHNILINRGANDQHPQSAITNLTNDLASKAPLASPALTGTPTAPTAIVGTGTTQIATTAFVKNEPSIIGDGAVTTVKLADEAVTSPKMDVREMQVAGLLPTAWCSFDAQNDVMLDSLNMSVVETTTGQFDVTFDTAMDNVDYVVVCSGRRQSGAPNSFVQIAVNHVITLNENGFRASALNQAVAVVTMNRLFIQVFGGLE